MDHPDFIVRSFMEDSIGLKRVNLNAHDFFPFQLQAMKLLMRWLLGLKNNNNNSGTSTLRLLYTVIVHEGDLMERGKIK